MLTRAVLQRFRVLTQHTNVAAQIGRSLYNLELTSAYRQLIGQCLYSSSVGVQYVTGHDKNERNKEEKENEKRLTATERLQQLDEQGLKRLKVLKLEYEVMQMREPEAVPENMIDEYWLEILGKNSYFARKRQYSFWVRKEKQRKSVEEKKRKRTEYVKERMAKVEESERNNEVGNRFLPRVSEAHMDRFYISKLANALLHQNPTLVLDMDYENYMSMREITNLHDQFWFLYGKNKRIQQPFNLVACSVNPVGEFMNRFKKVAKHMNFDSFYCEMTEKSYLDLYPRDRLVYLTPDSRKVLRYFDPDDIYIIGGLVDISQIKPLSFTKAKKQGIRMASLPLDEYLSWQKGSKALTLDQMIQILGEVMVSGDWKRALQYVPHRKVCNPLYGDQNDTEGNLSEEAADGLYLDEGNKAV
ncbi:hypothetical protein CHS0354_023567 [Potamilus streckersoni]|uniref:RNA (guanine-9-)-methyltransferase domain-containing protein 1 n=1 Tax=Potamilus streckersoni TaxID=2493646 RepID=A0AAE0VQR1_9BIVA|nr:hypothetical protein CHS0354_023567 [Potamilus streckersoni]